MLEWTALLAHVQLGQTHPLRATPWHPPFVTQCPAPPVNSAPTANSYRNKLEGGTTRSFFDRAESIRQVGGCDLFDLGGFYFLGLVSLADARVSVSCRLRQRRCQPHVCAGLTSWAGLREEGRNMEGDAWISVDEITSEGSVQLGERPPHLAALAGTRDGQHRREAGWGALLQVHQPQQQPLQPGARPREELGRS